MNIRQRRTLRQYWNNYGFETLATILVLCVVAVALAGCGLVSIVSIPTTLLQLIPPT